ncbi:hypothetical protein A2930_01370 [Candidatus Giovannonibacteria bacterium RIFCSPLOWO2_01_FULL_45_34]|uniref:Uncharacterized protein n=1 Tax=Candidatus Giovannonibacteria bacterium RIFCSPLOWO2_01_FULL_45_34 TaxID=1798351 RepID=A0A1F5X0J2_9BACT|nr:MAG: hypothetical protein A3C73_03115 [Candidatus Giovannonibacteria bacterium RIFCSPHIGHO2_02_FULL_44_11]OGF81428.1 MAG: hypothetical protein A2930_01370 [Candidatus Giovannonibacteria bacterium RIFCSPLOWO2_01_FULL_45_34]
MKRNRDLIQVFAGDVVLVENLPGIGRNLKLEAFVTKVTTRYGGHGRIQTAPLINAIFTGDEKETHFDNSYITKVISRAQRLPGPPENVVKKVVPEDSGRGIRSKHSGIWCGPLQTLAEHVLAGLEFHIPHFVHGDKLHDLYQKQRAGLVKKRHGVYWVRKKVFAKWVRANATKILWTTRELNVNETERNEDYARVYWADVKRETDEEFDRLAEIDQDHS